MDERPPRILALAGSLRKASFNRKILRYAIEGARAAGGKVEELGPEWLRLPLYDGDLEVSGRFPDDVETWRRKILECDGLLIASPEYNHGISGVLKNAIDWGSRPPNVFSGKVAASFGITPGAQGTARSQMNLRVCLAAINVWVVPKTVLVPHAREAFDDAGNLRNERQIQELIALGGALVAAVLSGVARG
ncbi:MAG: NAD(P)H-dependent oxidoreductase [Candidatus Rokubacteria bacterium]|nr:NAD(P)H-dependent oxidoreductase [Candidatus Rokubacteria bacterium]